MRFTVKKAALPAAPNQGWRLKYQEAGSCVSSIAANIKQGTGAAALEAVSAPHHTGSGAVSAAANTWPENVQCGIDPQGKEQHWLQHWLCVA